VTCATCGEAKACVKMALPATDELWFVFLRMSRDLPHPVTPVIIRRDMLVYWVKY
jgi:hypothetical protein